MNPSVRTRPRLLACVTVCLFGFVQSVLAAQQVGLRVQVVQGEGAKNLIEQVPALPLTVRVVDRTNRPIQGAMVVFTSPTSGASGDFENGMNTFSTITDEDGVAVAREFRPNDVEGSYQIRVRVEHLGETAVTTIHQTNIGAKKSIGKIIAIMAVAGAAGVAGAAFAAKGGGGSSQSSTPPPGPGSTPSGGTTITFGTSTVGAPR